MQKQLKIDFKREKIMAHALNMYNDEYIKFAYEGENYIVEIQQDDEPWNLEN